MVSNYIFILNLTHSKPGCQEAYCGFCETKWEKYDYSFVENGENLDTRIYSQMHLRKIFQPKVYLAEKQSIRMKQKYRPRRLAPACREK